MSRNYMKLRRNNEDDWRNAILARLQLLIPSWDQGRPVGVYNI